MDLQEVVEDYLIGASAENGYAKCTISCKKYYLKNFVFFLKEKGINCFNNVKRENIVDHLEALWTHGYKPATSKLALSSIKMLFRWLKRERVVKANPAVLVDTPKLEERLPKALNYCDIVKILRAIEEDGNTRANALSAHAIVETLYGTGMRVSELCQLNFTDLSFNGTVFIRNGKGGKQRIIPIGQKALDAIALYLINHYMIHGYSNPTSKTPLFIAKTGKRIDRMAIHRTIKRYAQRAEINKNVHPHVFRHSYATHMLVRKAPLRVLQDLLGHSDISTTSIYLKLDLSDIENSFKQYHKRYEFTDFPISKGKRILGRPKKIKAPTTLENSSLQGVCPDPNAS